MLGKIIIQEFRTSTVTDKVTYTRSLIGVTRFRYNFSCRELSQAASSLNVLLQSKWSSRFISKYSMARIIHVWSGHLLVVSRQDWQRQQWGCRIIWIIQTLIPNMTYWKISDNKIEMNAKTAIVNQPMEISRTCVHWNGLPASVKILTAIRRCNPWSNKNIPCPASTSS